VDWYRSVLVHDLLGRDWTTFKLVQYAGHVGGTALCLSLLARYGGRRWMADRAGAVPPFPATGRTHIALAAATAGGTTTGALWVALDRGGSAVDTIRIAALTFAAMTAASAALLALMRRAAVPAR
jgi:hypothetical protein